MKVILRKNILGLGDFGEVKEVANGYARNYLLPRNIAVSAYVGTSKAIEHQRKVLEHSKCKRENSMKDLIKSLEEFGVFEVPVKIGKDNKIFGSVNNIKIAEVLASKDFIIDRRKIIMHESLRTLGLHTVKIQLLSNVNTSIKIDIVPDALSLKKMNEIEEEEQKRKKRVSKRLETKEHATPDASNTTKAGAKEKMEEKTSEVDNKTKSNSDLQTK